MRSDAYSEWDEYIGLESMKRAIENAVARMNQAVNALQKNGIDNLADHLDCARVALCAVRTAMDEYTMVGTQITKKESAQ